MFKKTLVRCLKHRDTVSIKNLNVSCITGKDFWARSVTQPLDVSIDLETSFAKASQTDDLKYSLNYATISRNVLDYFDRNRHRNFQSLELIANSVFDVVLSKENGSNGSQGKVSLTNSKSEIRCDNVQLEMTKSDSDTVRDAIAPRILKINGLKLLTVIGIFNFERLQKQIVDLNVELSYTKSVLNYSELIDQITKYIETAQFKTVEALVENVAYLTLKFDPQITDVDVGVLKPNAILFAQGVGVSIKRQQEDLKNMKLLEFDTSEDIELSIPNFNSENKLSTQDEHTVFIAFGSNYGDQFKNINEALEKLEEEGFKLESTSSIYESKPMYVLDQPNFYNGVIRGKTSLKPYELLALLKKIEYQDLQRVKLMDNGPRSIDLDILLYDNLIMNEQDLKIPHISMIDRTFVMAPLCELLGPDEVHPVTAETFHSHLSQLLSSESDISVQESNKLINVVPYSEGVLKFDTFDNTTPTLIMGILNVTPDSFSDGGVNYQLDAARETIKYMIDAGVEIIDVGGCSTRPGSEQASEAEELQRVLPLIKLIRELSNKVCISIDTYRSKVAEQLILAGAHIVNDISAGKFDPAIFDVVAKYRVPFIVNHTRGDISNMTQLTNYSSTSTEGVFLPTNHKLSEKESQFVKVMGSELLDQLRLAYSKGVRKWQIILDPGIGFAKNTEQNISVVRTTPVLKQLYFDNDTHISFSRLPVLLGPCRKKFIGEITGIADPKQREPANLAMILGCIGFGGDIVRVHDFTQAVQIKLVADALYKN